MLVAIRPPGKRNIDYVTGNHQRRPGHASL